jgi:8-oxo-dGTP pyrophosphatase MutT (NUDIX family)
MIPPLVELNFPGSASYPRWVFPGLSKEGKELAKEIFMALVGRPGSSTQPVIQAAAEKAVAEELGADPDLIPDHDSPERQVEEGGIA